MEYKNDDMLYCPMIEKKITVSECAENCDIANGLFKPDGLIHQYGERLVENWREVCMKCKYHEE